MIHPKASVPKKDTAKGWFKKLLLLSSFLQQESQFFTKKYLSPRDLFLRIMNVTPNMLKHVMAAMAASSGKLPPATKQKLRQTTS